MAGSNLTNNDGMLKDSYAKKKAVTSQSGKGFQKLALFRKRMPSLNFSKFSGGVPKGGK